MNFDSVVAAYRHEGRTLVWPGETLVALPGVTRRFSGGNVTVTAFALDEANADAAIRAEIAHFDGRPFEWKAFSFDGPLDLVARLRAAGSTVEGREAMLVYDLADGLMPFEKGRSIDVRRVDQIEGLDDFQDVAEAAFNRDYASTTQQLTETIRSGQSGHDAYVANFEGIAASVGRLYTNTESAFAGLYGGGTRPEFRGRGLIARSWRRRRGARRPKVRDTSRSTPCPRACRSCSAWASPTLPTLGLHMVDKIARRSTVNTVLPRVSVPSTCRVWVPGSVNQFPGEQVQSLNRKSRFNKEKIS